MLGASERGAKVQKMRRFPDVAEIHTSTRGPTRSLGTRTMPTLHVSCAIFRLQLDKINASKERGWATRLAARRGGGGGLQRALSQSIASSLERACLQVGRGAAASWPPPPLPPPPPLFSASGWCYVNTYQVLSIRSTEERQVRRVRRTSIRAPKHIEGRKATCRAHYQIVQFNDGVKCKKGRP